MEREPWKGPLFWWFLVSLHRHLENATYNSSKNVTCLGINLMEVCVTSMKEYYNT
jgi:hypothetical protein